MPGFTSWCWCTIWQKVLKSLGVKTPRFRTIVVNFLRQHENWTARFFSFLAFRFVPLLINSNDRQHETSLPDNDHFTWGVWPWERGDSSKTSKNPCWFKRTTSCLDIGVERWAQFNQQKFDSEAQPSLCLFWQVDFTPKFCIIRPSALCNNDIKFEKEEFFPKQFSFRPTDLESICSGWCHEISRGALGDS